MATDSANKVLAGFIAFLILAVVIGATVGLVLQGISNVSAAVSGQPLAVLFNTGGVMYIVVIAGIFFMLWKAVKGSLGGKTR